MGVCRPIDQPTFEGGRENECSTFVFTQVGNGILVRQKKKICWEKLFLCRWKKLMFGWLEREMHGVALVRGDVIIPSVFLSSQDIPEIHDDGCID